jgi:glycosyltransferase involved in cell wall biosynthesis
MNSPATISVCFISFKAYPIFNPSVEKVFGGAEVDLYLLATELAKDPQYEVSFIVGDYGQPDGEVREGVRLFKAVKSDRFMMLEGAKVWRAMKRADADIYMHEACSLVTALAAAFCRVHGRKFVYRTASSREPDGRYFAEKQIRGLFVKRAFRAADLFIVQNEQDAVNAVRTIGRQAMVIRNACRISSTRSANKDGILWVGRSLPVKRPELFLKLAQALPDKRFVMICPEGVGDWNYESLVQESQGLSNLTFIRRVPFQEIDRYFEQAAVFVNTSDSEGFPNTFVQACKSGTAIASLRVNPDGFLDAHRCGRCAEGDWERFCTMVRELAETETGRELGENGRAYIRQYHDLEAIIETYKRLFIGLAGKIEM